jgi:hypothetical protein
MCCVSSSKDQSCVSFSAVLFGVFMVRNSNPRSHAVNR